jgi:signal transduction histidine kinase/ActR/RegA family two-component response regulator
MVARNGTELPVADSGAPIRDSDGNVVGVVLVFRDLSAEIKISEEIQRIAKLDSLALMAGGIAHDFNNLLAAIAGNISLAQAGITEHNYIDANACLQDAERAAFRASALSTQLLSFSKGNAPVRRFVDIAALIRESVAIALTGSNCRCEVKEAGPIWPLEADPGQLSQVLNNVLINGRQAMPAGGTLQVTISNELIEAGSSLPLAPGPYVRLEITDQGIGIAEDIIGNIFDPFFTTKPKGSGLGLASVHSIVRNHQGHVGVLSVLGAGSTFTIILPAQPTSRRVFEATQASAATHRPWNILVLDDEELISAAVKRLLESKGHTVTTVSDGSQVVPLWRQAKASGNPFDLAILDLTIPGGVGGQQVMEELRKLEPNVRAIAYSGYANDPVLSNYAEYGFSARIAKPFHVADMLTAVAELQQRQA